MNWNEFFFYHFRNLFVWKRNWVDRDMKIYKQIWKEIDEFVNLYIVLHALEYLTFDIKCVSVHICHVHLHVFPDCCVIINQFLNYITLYQSRITKSNVKIYKEMLKDVYSSYLQFSFLIIIVILFCYLCLFVTDNFDMYLVSQWSGMSD